MCEEVAYQVIEVQVKIANFQLINFSNGVFLANFSELDGVNLCVDVFLKLRLDLLNELEPAFVQADIIR